LRSNLFISFEGVDGSGKSTQIEKLRDWFISIGEEVLMLRDPGTTDISERIRDILLDRRHMQMHAVTECLLYAAARSQLVTEQILPALQSGRQVISDRFYDSTTAYQGFGRSLPEDLIKDLNRIGSHSLVPDLTVLLDLDPETGLARAGKHRSLDRMESGGSDFIRRVRAGFLNIAEAEKHRFIVLDASDGVEKIHEKIISEVQRRLKKSLH